MALQSAFPNPHAQSNAFCRSIWDTPGLATHHEVPSKNVVFPSGGDHVVIGIDASAFSTATAVAIASPVLKEVKNENKDLREC